MEKKVLFIQITGRKRATLFGAVPMLFQYFADATPRFHDVGQCKSFFWRQQCKKYT